jgi:hypothetical protein
VPPGYLRWRVPQRSSLRSLPSPPPLRRAVASELVSWPCSRGSTSPPARHAVHRLACAPVRRRVVKICQAAVCAPNVPRKDRNERFPRRASTDRAAPADTTRAWPASMPKANVCGASLDVDGGGDIHVTCKHTFGLSRRVDAPNAASARLAPNEIDRSRKENATSVSRMVCGAIGALLGEDFFRDA